MPYTVHMLYPTQGEPPPSKQLDGAFATIHEAWEAGSAEVLSCQLRSVEASFQIRDAGGQLVEALTEQAEG